MSIVIIGADGQLGSDVMTAFADDHTAALTEKEIDVTSKESVREAIMKHNPPVVINTAAFTHVDKCESEQDLAHKVNAEGAKHVAKICAELGAVLVHISTDYVFDGRKGTPYTEGDIPAPINMYGRTKLEGEGFVRNFCSHYYIVRTSGLYGLNPCIGKATGDGGDSSNFVDKMLKLSKKLKELRVVSDEILSPTFTEDLARQIKIIVDTKLPFGIYHATSEGECSWFEFAREVFELSGIKMKVVPTTSDEWKAPAKRPPYSVLENAALKKHDCNSMPHWKAALKTYLKKKRKS